MKWTYRIPNKLGVSLLLMGVLVLVLMNNLNERANSRKLKKAFESIYEDRLLAESYILRLAAELHQIQELVESPNRLSQKEVETKLSAMEELNLLYLNTELTETEETHFVHFEKITWELGHALKEGRLGAANLKIQEAIQDLHILSEIQVSEAQALLNHTNRIFSSGSANSQFEIALIIVIALMVQAILFASQTLRTRNTSIHRENLN